MLSEQEAQRFLRLVNEMGEEMDKRRGWLSAVARTLGVHRSTLTKVLSGDREVSETYVHRAAAALGLPRAYFTADDDRHFREWLTVAPRAGAAEFAEVVRQVRARTVAVMAAIGRDAPPDVLRATLDDLVIVAQRARVIGAYESARNAVQREVTAPIAELVALRLTYELESIARAMGVVLDE